MCDGLLSRFDICRKVRVLSKAIFVTVKLVFVDDMQYPFERVSISIPTSVHRLSQVSLRLEVKSTPFIVTETVEACDYRRSEIGFQHIHDCIDQRLTG